MTDRPRLYPGHQHQWSEHQCEAPLHGEYGDIWVCSDCGREWVGNDPDQGPDALEWLPDSPASPMVTCTVCGFQAPRNAAGLDGDMTGARARVAVFPQIENGTAYTAAELDAALTADEDAQPEQETR